MSRLFTVAREPDYSLLIPALLQIFRDEERRADYSTRVFLYDRIAQCRKQAEQQRVEREAEA